MSKLFIISLPIMLTLGCTNEKVLEHEQQANYLQPKKEGSLASDFIQCNDNFYWSTQKFEEVYTLHKSTIPQFINQTDIVTPELKEAPLKVGHGFSNTYLLSESDSNTCNAIYTKINGKSRMNMDHLIYQFFDYEDISSKIRENKDFQTITEKRAILYNAAYEFDPKTKLNNYLYTLSLPVTVSCENKWSVKPNPSLLTSAIFKPPQAKCHFSLSDFELELAEGQKIVIALEGYYETDRDYPDKNLLVQIERIGFKKTP